MHSQHLVLPEPRGTTHSPATHLGCQVLVRGLVWLLQERHHALNLLILSHSKHTLGAGSGASMGAGSQPAHSQVSTHDRNMIEIATLVHASPWCRWMAWAGQRRPAAPAGLTPATCPAALPAWCAQPPAGWGEIIFTDEKKRCGEELSALHRSMRQETTCCRTGQHAQLNHASQFTRPGLHFKHPPCLRTPPLRKPGRSSCAHGSAAQSQPQSQHILSAAQHSAPRHCFHRGRPAPELHNVRHPAAVATRAT
jgi:hypothetical protein